jgi:hypothetical protein
LFFSGACDADSGGSAQSPIATGEKTAEAPVKFDTGDAGIDAFLTAVASRNEASVAEQLGSVQTLSGRDPGFSDARGYLDRVKDCKIQKAIKDMPRTAWVYWACPDRAYRQTIDAKYRAPKMTVTELY